MRTPEIWNEHVLIRGGAEAVRGAAENAKVCPIGVNNGVGVLLGQSIERGAWAEAHNHVETLSRMTWFSKIDVIPGAWLSADAAICHHALGNIANQRGAPGFHKKAKRNEKRGKQQHSPTAAAADATAAPTPITPKADRRRRESSVSPAQHSKHNPKKREEQGRSTYVLVNLSSHELMRGSGIQYCAESPPTPRHATDGKNRAPKEKKPQNLKLQTEGHAPGKSSPSPVSAEKSYVSQLVICNKATLEGAMRSPWVSREQRMQRGTREDEQQGQKGAQQQAAERKRRQQQ
ncbi:hypothetical protein C8R45DRAFT_922847 [Mycena sanguinolenta]|nr:hypothetical protein C8R45DRAFT_922847 [Mycena sanguinolenta]